MSTLSGKKALVTGASRRQRAGTRRIVNLAALTQGSKLQGLQNE
jgi:hypothetical protein